jgi:hypothetical protein
LTAFLLVNLVLWLAATIDGFDFFDPNTWVRWDSIHYLDIAEGGFTHFECLRLTWWDPVSAGLSVWKLLGFDVPLPDSCGNAGWFPGYPASIRLIGVTGMSPAAAGVAIAVAGQLGTLYALWIWFLRDEEPRAALTALLAGAFFFGHVYYRAVFPMSMTTLLLLAYVYLVSKDRWLLAGVVGAAAAFFYPTAFLVGPVTVAWLVIARPDFRVRAKLVPATLTAGLTALGFLAVIIVQWLQTDEWGAFFDIQGQFGYGLFPATRRLADVLNPLFDIGVKLETVPNLHTGLVAITIVSIAAIGVHRWKDLTSIQRWLVLSTIVFWIFPLMLGGRASLYRIESLLLPAVILLPRMPRWLQLSVAVITMALSYPMALLFFRNVLI